MSYAITIYSNENKGVLRNITDLIYSKNINISYTYSFLGKNNMASVNLELDHVSDIDSLIYELKEIEEVIDVKINSSMEDIFGKRIIIMGGGAQVSQVALGAITEADRHNIRGEHISVDTIPLIGEAEIAEAILGLERLPRVSVLVLAGSIMGGEITKAAEKIKKEHNIVLITLNMLGSVTDVADMVVTDPVQAGVLSVMSTSEMGAFNISKIRNKRI